MLNRVFLKMSVKNTFISTFCANLEELESVILAYNVNFKES